MSELIDNHQRKIATLKQVIRGLHEGEDPEQVRARLRTLVGTTSYDEIVAMEGELIADGMPAEEVQRMCDLHSQVMREVLAPQTAAALPPGHPVAVLRAENSALQQACQAMRQVLGAVATPALPALPAEVLQRWRAELERLLQVEQHYARKENLLFPFLEQHGVEGPSQVMWGKDDEVRNSLAALREALAESAAGIEEWRLLASQVAVPLCDQIEEMIFKEEQILLPTALDKLSAAEWAAVAQESARFGWCLIEPPPAFVAEEQAAPAPQPYHPGGERVAFSAGSLSLEQLRGIFAVLPVDLTFVDANDRVVFFSEGPDRIFPRPRAIIGRKVHNCHPPKSVHLVEQILADFKRGAHDVAAFWIPFAGLFAHIRYFAVRDEQGSYLGTLEVTQNLSPLRALEGERRLLAYQDREETA